MNRKRYGWIVILSAISGAVLSQSAVAAIYQTAKAAVSLDWSHLQLSVTGPSGVAPNVEYSNPDTELFSRINDVYSSVSDGVPDEKVTKNWTETASADTVVVGRNSLKDDQAHALASASIFSVNTQLIDDVNPNDWVTADATGYRRIDFTIDGPGTLAISVPYTLSISSASCHPDCSSQRAEISGFTTFRWIFRRISPR